jgi:hypothetical protein
MSDPDERAEVYTATCPSAPPEPGSALLGVVMGKGQVAYVNPPVPATQDMLDGFAKSGVPIENRMRFSGPCMEHRCVQWVGARGAGRCGLIDHALVDLGITKEAEILPRCSIRATCRWFAQHRRAACAACPEIIRRPSSD